MISASCHGDSAPRGGTATAVQVVLVGNPNVGKSTVFNALTRGRQHVGNWPGKTVQVATGTWRTPDGPLRLTDLPGAYSLQARSPDEALVAEALQDRPDAVVLVLDAANLARNLYLAGQVLALGLPTLAVLTMSDVAAARGLRIDAQALSEALGVPVVEVQARKKGGADLLAGAVTRLLDAPTAPPPPDDRPADGDDVALAERRYTWVRDIVATAVRRPRADRPTWSDRLDQVLASRRWGLPCFLLVMWAAFTATTSLAAPIQDALAGLVEGPLAGGLAWMLAAAGLDGTPVAALLLDGLLAGLGMVLSFAPLMAIMFMLLSLLEDSGYMARAAFVADRLLRSIGLPGHAFLPLIVGYGCNVPAIAATRALPNARHRLLTALLVPFTSCTARLTVFMLVASVFFGAAAGTVVFGLYVLSVALVVLAGLALRRSVFRHDPEEPLLLELPPYRLPTLRLVGAQTWSRLAAFLRKASGIIVATVAVVWLLTAIPLGDGRFGEVEPADSLYGAVSEAIAPVFAPAGFGEWHAAGALVTGFVAKEAVVSTFAQTYGISEDSASLGDRLSASFTEASGGHPVPAALAFLVFVLAYTPCVATLAAQRAEIGWRWTSFGVGMQLTLAWVLAVAVFQVGRLIT